MSRIYNVGAEGDGGKTQKVLESFGIQVRTAEGGVKPLNTVLGELNERFKTLTQSEKLQIEQSVGGKNEYATLYSNI